MDEIHVVDEAAEERLLERRDHSWAVVADCLSHLRSHLLATGFEHVSQDVGAADDLARPEERAELGVVHDDADVAKRLGGVRHPLQHPLPRTVEALHVPDLHDLPRLSLRLDDPVGVGERDAHRLLDEDVQAVVERVERRLRVDLRGRADDDGVERRPLEEPAVIRIGRLEVVETLQRVANGRAGIGDRGEVEPVVHPREVVEAAADHADAQAHARTCLATFSKANAISSRSRSSHSGETLTWIARSSRSSVRGQSGAAPPAASIAVRTGAQNG